MVTTVSAGRLRSSQIVAVAIDSPLDLLAALERERVDTLICGGITRDVRDVLEPAAIEIVDNVACSTDEILAALADGAVASGFGLSGLASRPRGGRLPHPSPEAPPEIDCLRCSDRVCVRGLPCPRVTLTARDHLDPEARRVVEAALDLAQEDQRQLCRLAEVVYFGLEMGHRRIGLAYCVDLQEPAEILAGVLRRFFEVVPVCCKVGGTRIDDGDPPGRGAHAARHAVACNPLGQAAVLNQRETDLNIAVGLCVGVDCLFARASRAPVTTLFVKDRSLANNPIGALYSEYYLRESLDSAHGRAIGAHGPSSRR